MGRDRGKDNCGEYDDGSKYCYSCGYSVSANGHNKLKLVEAGLEQVCSDKERSVVSLPEDVDCLLPAVAMAWLSKYSLSNTDIISNKLLWSESKKYLVFPIFSNENNLLAWQGRYFGDNTKHPKWISYGDMKDVFHIIPVKEQYERIVLVEDIVSAIKVGHVCPCMPLFGSAVGYSRLKRLSMLTKEVVVWLDSDKRKDAMKELLRASRVGLQRSVVFSENDPKLYSYNEIKEYLNVL